MKQLCLIFVLLSNVFLYATSPYVVYNCSKDITFKHAQQFASWHIIAKDSVLDLRDVLSLKPGDSIEILNTQNDSLYTITTDRMMLLPVHTLLQLSHQQSGSIFALSKQELASTMKQKFNQAQNGQTGYRNVYGASTRDNAATTEYAIAEMLNRMARKEIHRGLTFNNDSRLRMKYNHHSNNYSVKNVSGHDYCMNIVRIGADSSIVFCDSVLTILAAKQTVSFPQPIVSDQQASYILLLTEQFYDCNEVQELVDATRPADESLTPFKRYIVSLLKP